MSRRTRIATAFALALLSAGVCIATILEPQWFEVLFGSAPDEGDGSLETSLAIVIATVACVAFLWIGTQEWRRVPGTATRDGDCNPSKAASVSAPE